MSSWERWAFNLSALAVTVTGLVYLWMKYLLDNDDPFAVVNHPWQGATLHLHVLTAPAFLLLFGSILNSHILAKCRAGTMPNRRSGLISLGAFAAMAASGYLLQTTSHASLLWAFVVVHIGGGVMFSTTYIMHLLISVRLLRTSRGGVREVA